MLEYEAMPPLYLTYLNRFDIEAIALTDAEILAAIEGQLVAQGRGEAVIEPRMHLEPGVARGHFNVLRGSLGGEVDAAGVKVVSDFYDNYLHGLPSELAVLLLLDRRIGVPKAIVDASAITDMRTGALTALGAKYLARKGSKVLGHVGARGTAYWNVRLLAGLFDFDEIRVHSRRPESRDAFAARLRRDLGRVSPRRPLRHRHRRDGDVVDDRHDRRARRLWPDHRQRRRHRRDERIAA